MGKVSDEMGEDFTLFDDWGRWLDAFGWSYFATFTFRCPKGRRIERMADRAVKWGHAATGRGCLIFLCGEYGKQSGRYHLHGLINVGPAGRLVLDDKWRSEYGITDFRRFQQGKGAAHYVGKYVLKDAWATGEYTFAGIGEGFAGWEQWKAEEDQDGQETDAKEASIDKTFGQKGREKRRKVSSLPGKYARYQRGLMSGYDRYLQEMAKNRVESGPVSDTFKA